MLYYKCLEGQQLVMKKRKGMTAIIPFLILEETTEKLFGQSVRENLEW